MAYAQRVNNGTLAPTSVETRHGAVVSQYGQKLWKACDRRTFFTTRAGLMGLGSYFPRPGHRLVEAHRGLTPLVLRPTRNGRYTLVGEAYLHGKMDLADVNADMNAAREFEVV